jgi:hypothetical protein
MLGLWHTSRCSVVYQISSTTDHRTLLASRDSIYLGLLQYSPISQLQVGQYPGFPILDRPLAKIGRTRFRSIKIEEIFIVGGGFSFNYFFIAIHRDDSKMGTTARAPSENEAIT